jgi:hypothetical protein
MAGGTAGGTESRRQSPRESPRKSPRNRRANPRANPTREEAPMTRRSMVTLVLLAVAVATFVYHARIYWSWTEDDAFISLRYAQNLSRGQGLVFNPGERVEGYSNFSWVLLAAAAMRAGLDPVTMLKVIGLASGVVALLLSFQLARRTVPSTGMTPLVIAFYLAISPVLVQHSVAGLETSFFAMLLVASVLVASAPVTGLRRVGLVVLLLLLSVTRPEGPLMAVVILFVRALQNRLAGGVFGDEPDWEARTVPLQGALKGRAALVRCRRLRHRLRRLFHLALELLRRAVPEHVLRQGERRLARAHRRRAVHARFSARCRRPLFIGLALVPLALGPRRPAYASALAVVVAYFGFVLISGGDWMFHYRFFAHVLPVLLALVAAGLDRLLSLPRPGTLRARDRLRRRCGRAAGHDAQPRQHRAAHRAHGAAGAATSQLSVAELRRARPLVPRQHARPGARSRSAMSAPSATSRIATSSTCSGCVDPHISRLHGRMHYKSDASYVLSRQPDYIVLVSLNDDGAGYSFQRIPDYGMNRRPEFHDGYELIRTVPQYWQNEFVLVYKRRG